MPKTNVSVQLSDSPSTIMYDEPSLILKRDVLSHWRTIIEKQMLIQQVDTERGIVLRRIHEF